MSVKRFRNKSRNLQKKYKKYRFSKRKGLKRSQSKKTKVRRKRTRRLKIKSVRQRGGSEKAINLNVEATSFTYTQFREQRQNSNDNDGNPKNPQNPQEGIQSNFILQQSHVDEQIYYGKNKIELIVQVESTERTNIETLIETLGENKKILLPRFTINIKINNFEIIITKLISNKLSHKDFGENQILWQIDCKYDSSIINLAEISDIVHTFLEIEIEHISDNNNYKIIFTEFSLKTVEEIKRNPNTPNYILFPFLTLFYLVVNNCVNEQNLTNLLMYNQLTSRICDLEISEPADFTEEMKKNHTQIIKKPSEDTFRGFEDFEDFEGPVATAAARKANIDMGKETFGFKPNLSVFNTIPKVNLAQVEETFGFEAPSVVSNQQAPAKKNAAAKRKAEVKARLDAAKAAPNPQDFMRMIANKSRHA